jgi:hypothetical protein
MEKDESPDRISLAPQGSVVRGGGLVLIEKDESPELRQRSQQNVAAMQLLYRVQHPSSGGSQQTIPTPILILHFIISSFHFSKKKFEYV